ncbi:hypothetical protein G6F70_005598 [Rhizopus microsporus]|nr:hypothetical protein G6F71_005053 [Rhizopus microsporus]KAG1198668.1 hypothetical protein G6F70_005598 [Rhizopus microsporus]KAG1210734.1 hypothetical protein G6F69_005217 [Rhizopus microsporus]KAG1232926.1 hypothetical protein G6F67_004654 [Rhizopus microsporus]KAG1264368.1 hypothetical protein G6F68_004400 [Rhizopus microsporus]
MSIQEKDHYKLQRPFRLRRSLRELVHKPTSQQSLKLPPLPPYDPDKEEYAYDVLYECQRGSLTVGYSSKTLLQFDPNPWCDADMKFTPMNIDNYQLPDPTWQWVSKHWMIDMTGDVDEAGWQYALKFHGADWHGNYKHLRSFNEVKTSVLVDVDDDSMPESSSFNHQHFTKQLQTCRLDRERMALFTKAIQSGNQDKLLEKISFYINILDFEDTKHTLIQLLTAQKERKFTKEIQAVIQSLGFYSNKQSIVNHMLCQSSS